MRPSTELLAVVAVFALLIGWQGDWTTGSLALGVATGVTVFLVRYLEGDTVVQKRDQERERAKSDVA